MEKQLPSYLQQYQQCEPGHYNKEQLTELKEHDLLGKCEKCEGTTVSESGMIYCNDCGITENIFFSVNIKPRQQG